MIIRSKCIGMTICVLCLVGLAAQKNDGPLGPKSKQGLDAVTAFERAKSKAESEYEQAIQAACKHAIKSLEAARAAAMRSDDLDEANRIQATIDAIKVDAEGDIKVMTVDAKKGWENAIDVKKGDKLKLSATGKWCFDVRQKRFAGPDGVPRDGANARWAFLEGNLGDEDFAVGSNLTFTAKQDGVLRLRMNDPFRGDNEGVIEVRISVR